MEQAGNKLNLPSIDPQILSQNQEMPIIEIDFDFLLEDDQAQFQNKVNDPALVKDETIRKTVACALNRVGETPQEFKCMICHELGYDHKLCN